MGGVESVPMPEMMMSTTCSLFTRACLTAEMSLTSPWVMRKCDEMACSGTSLVDKRSVSFDGVRATASVLTSLYLMSRNWKVVRAEQL